MKTGISTFCESLLHSLNVLPPALTEAAESLENGSDPTLLHQPLATLNEVRARLRSLVEKLGSQQAYLLIFGPLKSGKSTLMNAISGAYVSEVTSLPGYPCLVYVSHSKEPHFSVTRYNGRESVFADGSVLKDVIADSHVALAQQIRATEQRGDAFDPRTHFTEAIRRVDVKLPVESLAESSTVLVDTPGLYSRMNFGYDVLTREFRDSAACAVFVVKTDNLFLEQVFAEFNQLLDLFSRIFLVINVDSSKRDLQADGTLQPSAESHDPKQIIEAFKTLSMAGPLRKAYEENRVRIHAVDLMNAASGFLRGSGNGQNGGGNGAAKHNESFGAFLRDLTDYLNSTDYTIEFIRDSLRQGATLCEEVREVFEGSEMRQLRERQEALSEEMRALDEQITAVDRLLKVDWDATFQKVRAENASSGSQRAKAKAEEVRKQMREALDRWYATPDSLKALEQKHWDPVLANGARSLADDTRARLNVLTGTTLGGSEPAALVMTDLHAIGFRLGFIAEGALPKLNEQEALAPYEMTIDEEDVPVRKSFGDWFLFRRQATVRRRLFGEDLNQEIAPEVKEKRLPDTSRHGFLQIIDEVVKEKFPSLPGQFAEALLTGYVEKFRNDLLESLRETREQLGSERDAREVPFKANEQVLAAIESLNEHATRVLADLGAMAQKETALPGSPQGDDDQAQPEAELAAPASVHEPSAA